MKITYHGHSAVAIETDNHHRLLIDPFITGNPLSDLTVDDVKVDYILVTHGHGDHLGDTVQLANNNQATVIAIPEINHFVNKFGVKKIHSLNIGGSYDFPFGRVKMVFAQHSSGYESGDTMVYMGDPAGFILEIDGKVIYHAGDTAYFSDLTLLREDFDIDLAFLPIGDNFTMGPVDAVKASTAVSASTVVPIHYNTFPVIKQDPEEFVRLLPVGIGQALAVGESINY
ncbi:metal-dependent hydrolase [Vagococcus vulneris]|uniref:UPF0173 metal-dependent hydrolase CBF37_10055 n=1 Tax=Vagococcus vulneris TaxID=1977869 RepID=A0A429ZUB5_9ENTE|nr:metal-dependent hydrolase [Vagococcus vulneris]RST97323.1 metal-dependent hydrolase [Vagococcus vulneris]